MNVFSWYLCSRRRLQEGAEVLYLPPCEAIAVLRLVYIDDVISSLL